MIWIFLTCLVVFMIAYVIVDYNEWRAREDDEDWRD